MKKIILGVLGLALVSCNQIRFNGPADQCPHDLEVRCIDDINKAFPICQKAAKEKGEDFPADLECMKYLLSMEKDCWPCICMVAQVNKWHVKGCGK